MITLTVAKNSMKSLFPLTPLMAAMSGFHLGGAGGGHSPPLGMCLPPLGNPKIPLTDKNM